ncbi:MAG: nucleotidyl transferase AbiEii/AbiGii toxin family protein [Bacteroidetes bacterium]|nr:nucleotidyl transferase AbiEii/AbiGii toxin family protein [Bacteroidota bacterium]
MLIKKVVNPDALATIMRLMQLPELKDYRLAGGTALALRIGHRISDDIDLMTDCKPDKESVRSALLREFGKNIDFFEFSHGLTGFYMYNEKGYTIKIDILQNPVPFVEIPECIDNIRMASFLDIAAMKMSAIISRKTKKDFIIITINV